MIFDIIMDGTYTHKARFVAGVHRNDPTSSITYSSVVSLDISRLRFLLASLKDFDVCAMDIGNAYLNYKCRIKLWYEYEPEFEGDKSSLMIIVRAPHGLNSSG